MKKAQPLAPAETCHRARLFDALAALAARTPVGEAAFDFARKNGIRVLIEDLDFRGTVGDAPALGLYLAEKNSVILSPAAAACDTTDEKCQLLNTLVHEIRHAWQWQARGGLLPTSVTDHPRCQLLHLCQIEADAAAHGHAAMCQAEGDRTPHITLLQDYYRAWFDQHLPLYVTQFIQDFGETEKYYAEAIAYARENGIAALGVATPDNGTQWPGYLAKMGACFGGGHYLTGALLQQARKDFMSPAHIRGAFAQSASRDLSALARIEKSYGAFKKNCIAGRPAPYPLP
jgi:hypothetical protein